MEAGGERVESGWRVRREKRKREREIEREKEERRDRESEGYVGKMGSGG